MFAREMTHCVHTSARTELCATHGRKTARHTRAHTYTRTHVAEHEDRRQARAGRLHASRKRACSTVYAGASVLVYGAYRLACVRMERCAKCTRVSCVDSSVNGSSTWCDEPPLVLGTSTDQTSGRRCIMVASENGTHVYRRAAWHRGCRMGSGRGWKRGRAAWVWVL